MNTPVSAFVAAVAGGPVAAEDVFLIAMAEALRAVAGQFALVSLVCT